MNIKKTAIVASIAGLTTLQGIAHASLLALSDVPLSVSTSVSPNVMLLIDNSGSMRNIIWADGYSNSTTYASWGFNSGNGNIHLSDIDMGSCGSGGQWVEGTQGGSHKLLCLPDPVGNQRTRYNGNYLNYLFGTYADDTDLTDGTIPNDYRMNVARNVASYIVTNTPGIRFGISRFFGPQSQNWGHGATIDATCGSSPNTITNAVNNYTASTNTPLAEAYYELTRYFRGLSSYYHDNTNYNSPLQFRCQKSFIIAITDGFPTLDTNFPANDPDDTADNTAALPDWDGLHPATQQTDYPNFPQYSDGFQPAGSTWDEGFSLYLDDMAKFAYDIDLMKSGNDQTGHSWNDPSNNSQFAKQNINTYTVGFSTANQMLEDAASYGNGEYYTANNQAQLISALQKALTSIILSSASSSSVAINTSFVSAGALVYQGRFNSGDWTGQLLAFQIDTDPTSATFGQLLTNGSGPDGSQWDAGSNIPSASSREILTFNGSQGVAFRWSSLASVQQGLLGSSSGLLDYLRGDQSGEASNGGSYRNRSSRLGDIVDSAPLFVGDPLFRYPAKWDDGDGSPNDEPENQASAQSYTAFQTAHSNRDKLLYIGANDGMLHAFDALTGIEQFAYVPSEVFPNLKDLASPTYSHRYFVNGSPTAVDAFFGGKWHTVLVGGLNKGGQAIYALDITDPLNASVASSSPIEDNANKIVLWEFNDENDLDADGDGVDDPAGTGNLQHALGYTFSQPVIARMHDNHWAAIFGNGYNATEPDMTLADTAAGCTSNCSNTANSTGTAVLYILDAETGAVIRKIDTGVGSASEPNGLASVAPVDYNGDLVVDAVYAGDLRGNLWKFDISDSDKSKWDVAGWGSSKSKGPLFTACSGNCNGSNYQPITVRPEVGRHPSGKGAIIYFGTGKYLENTDKDTSSPQVQSFYGIWDNFTDSTWDVGGRSDLQQQTILAEDIQTFTNPTTNVDHTYPVRVTSNNSVDYSTKKGWYLDFTLPNSSTTIGERQVTNPLLRSGKIIFTTLIPTTDVCNAGGDSWLMELDARTGSRLNYSPFDFNHTGTFTTQDFVQYTPQGSQTPESVPASGKKLPVGSAATPGVMSAGDLEFKYTSGVGQQGNYDIDVTTENPGPSAYGRQSWVQLK